MNRIRRQLPLLVAMLVLVTGMFAGPAFAQESSEPVTITFWTTSQDNYADWISRFEAAHPNITVEAEFIGNYDDMAQKVQAAVAGGTTPDVAQFGQRYGLPQVIDSGVLIPAEEYLSEDDIADILPGLWSRFTYNGVKWAVPFGSSTPGVWYNKTMFEAAGLDPNTPPQTWDDVVTMGKALTKDTDGDGHIDQWGFGTCADSPWYFRPMVLQAGGTVYDAEGNPTINSPAAVESLKFFQDAVNVNGISAPAAHATAEDDFQNGKIGILFCSTSVRASFASTIGDSFDLGVAFLPENQQRAAGVGGNSLIVFKSDDARQAASEELVRFLTSTELTAEMGATTGYVAIRESAMSEPSIVDLLATDPYAPTIYDQLEYLKDTSINPADGLLWDGILQAIEQVETDPNADPQAVLDQLQSELEDYLANY